MVHLVMETDVGGYNVNRPTESGGESDRCVSCFLSLSLDKKNTQKHLSFIFKQFGDEGSNS